MPDLLDRRLETLLVEPRTAPAWTRTQRKIVRRQRVGRAAVVGSMAFLVLLVVAAALFTGPDESSDVQIGPPSTEPDAPFPPGWTGLPDPDLELGETRYPVLVGAGAQLVAWAGRATGNDPLVPLDAGTTFDAEAGAWQPLDGDVANGSGRPAAVGVGDEVLLMGTGSAAERWSPTTDGTSPFDLLDGCTTQPVAAAGRWWFACGTADMTGATSLRSVDPETGGWQDHGSPEVSIAFPQVTMAVGGDRLYLFGASSPLAPSGRVTLIAAFDLDEGRWVAAPPPPHVSSTGLSLAATETQVVAAADERVAVLDVQQGTWSDPVDPAALALPPEVPEPGGCVPAAAHAIGETLAVVGCEGVAVLQADGSWLSEPLPFPGHQAASAVAGDVLYLATPAGEVWAFVP